MESPTNQPQRNRRGSLDRDAIIAAAIDLADRDGVQKLTMRNLADELGYKVMALYNHVGKKDELLGLMVDSAIAPVVDAESRPSSDNPIEVVRAIALAVREALVRHPWSAELWNRNMPGPNRIQMMENLLSALDATDLSPEIAHYGFHAVVNHVVGYTLQEIGMNAGLSALDVDNPAEVADNFMAGLDNERFHHTIVHVRQHLDGESGSSFEFVLDLVLDGLVRVDRAKLGD